jgi:hypothetical protein
MPFAMHSNPLPTHTAITTNHQFAIANAMTEIERLLLLRPEAVLAGLRSFALTTEATAAPLPPDVAEALNGAVAAVASMCDLRAQHAASSLPARHSGTLS